MPVFFRPPADIRDFDESQKADELKQKWHDFIAERIGRRNENLFYDESNDPTPGTAPAEKMIPWNGFPNSIWRWFDADADPTGPAQAFAAADTLRPFVHILFGKDIFVERWRPGIPAMRQVVNNQLGEEVIPFFRQQDEYCEWHVDRDGDRITRISYTAEGPEYWKELVSIDPDLLESLYRRHVNDAARQEDLFWQFDVAMPEFVRNAQGQLELRRYVFSDEFRKGSYNKYNKWNTTHGAMHLTHPANTLGAEINLGADATVLRPSVAEHPSDTLPQRLICCAGFGGLNRSSDPLIGRGVNDLAKGGSAVTLANPVGLYLGKVEIDGLRNPDGVPIPEALRVRRASADGQMMLRVEVAPPEGATYTLDECEFDQKKLEFGGQIARKITVFLKGIAKPIQGRVGVEEACGGQCCNHPTALEFKKGIGLDENCDDLTDADWERDAPVTPADPVPGAADSLTTGSPETRVQEVPLDASVTPPPLKVSRAIG